MDEEQVDNFYDTKQAAQKKYPTFTDAMDPLRVSELEQNLVLYSKHREETLEAQKIDKRIKETKEEISKKSKPYDDKIKDFKAALNKLKKFIDKEISREELEKTMLEYAKLLDKEERAKKNDRELNSLKELAKELAAPYTDALSALKLKIAYLNALIVEKSEGLSDD
jgi:electron transfer flavoprotein alpha subunit